MSGAIERDIAFRAAAILADRPDAELTTADIAIGESRLSGSLWEIFGIPRRVCGISRKPGQRQMSSGGAGSDSHHPIRTTQVRTYDHDTAIFD